MLSSSRNRLIVGADAFLRHVSCGAGASPSLARLISTLPNHACAAFLATYPFLVSTVQEIETAIAKLTDKELAELRSFIWDRDIERDASSGRIDQLANEAIGEYRTGKTRPL